MKRRSHGILGTAAIAIASVLVLAGCGGSSGKAASTSMQLTLAYVGAITPGGPNDGLDAAKLAVAEANKRNPKVNLSIREVNVGDDDAVTEQDAKALAADSSVVGVIGPDSSGTARTVLPIYQDAGLVMVSPSATNAKLPDVIAGADVFHRILPDDDVQGLALRDFVTKRLGAKRVAYISDGSFYGQGLADGARDLLAQSGVAEAFTGSVDPDATDYTAVVKRIVSTHADLVYYGGSSPDAARLRAQMVAGGSKAEFLTGDGALTQEFVDEAGKAAAGSYIACGCTLADSTSSGSAGQFGKAFKAAYNREATVYTAESYDAANVLIRGIEAGSTTRADLRSYVDKIPAFDGVTKRIEFEPNGNVKDTSVYLFDAKDGKLHLLGASKDLVH